MSEPPRDPYARYGPQESLQPRFVPGENYPPPPYGAPPGQMPGGWPGQPPGGPQYMPPQGPPPRKKRHWVRNTFLGIAGLFVVIIIIAVASSHGGNSGSVAAKSSPAATDSAPSAAPTFTAAEQKFISDMGSQYQLGNGSASGNSAIVNAGNDVCTMLKDGSSASDITSAVQQGTSNLTAAQDAGLVKLAGQDLCPQDVPKPFQSQALLNVSGSGQYTTARYTVGGSGDYDIDWTYSQGSFATNVNFQIYGDGGSDFNVNDPNQLGSGGSGVVHVYNDAGTHYLEINSEGDWTVKVVTEP